jgi:hypothetical protein
VKTPAARASSGSDRRPVPLKPASYGTTPPVLHAPPGALNPARHCSRIRSAESGGQGSDHAGGAVLMTLRHRREQHRLACRRIRQHAARAQAGDGASGAGSRAHAGPGPAAPGPARTHRTHSARSASAPGSPDRTPGHPALSCPFPGSAACPPVRPGARPVHWKIIQINGRNDRRMSLDKSSCARIWNAPEIYTI